MYWIVLTQGKLNIFDKNVRVKIQTGLESLYWIVLTLETSVWIFTLTFLNCEIDVSEIRMFI